MAAKKIAHVLSDQEQMEAIAKRIKRAQGQLGAVARMLEEGRNCDEIVMQMSAVSKAVKHCRIYPNFSESERVHY